MSVILSNSHETDSGGAHPLGPGHHNGIENTRVDNVDNDQNAVQTDLSIAINNVVCSFSVRCHLNLRRIATTGENVEYKREMGHVVMRMRRPRATATIWSSGKVTIAGLDSEGNAKISARRCSRKLQRLGFKVRLCNYRVVNVLGTCSLPFGVRLPEFSMSHPKEASYEPELHPAVTYKIKPIKATLKIFSTGSITVTAPSVANIQKAVEDIYPLVEEHKMPKPVRTAKKNSNNMPQGLNSREIDVDDESSDSIDDHDSDSED
ncbi:TATA box-binding protein-like protein 1 [Anneissia japonica]|uniref:TATA box-binding protein-like protein 1 n=1 Tax=Anneissia japonica TaxID=1529436 RepID=UPI00142595A1|nr:TATA box-binding protein-like protein 1 [Anneissia japonica]